MSALFPLAAALDWLATSLLMSSLLIGLVLLIRHPVARCFGPGAAYAMWLLPVARLFLPPLPFAAATWIAPSQAPVTETMVIIDSAVAATTPAAVQPAAIDMLAILPVLLVTTWVIGAIVQLARLARHAAYWRQIARAAVPVARVGRITVARSDAIDGPLAIGLLRPFVLLPVSDRLAFDAQEANLAIDHELSHHRRGDLWANALFAMMAALLWFHPLLRRAIRAFRFDQEAACDATMIAAQPQARAAYARALAKAATGQPHHFITAAFASASLASPMVGSDRIKERLIMLTQPTHSKARRHAGIGFALALLTGASLLTATPARLSAQDAPPVPPAPPAPTDAPAPPAPPAPIAPPAPPVIDMDAGPGEHVVRIERDGATIVLHTDHELAPGEIERMVAEADRARAVADGHHRSADARHRAQTVIIRRHADAARAETHAAADAADAAATAAAEAAIATHPNSSRQHIVIRTRGDGPAGSMVMTPASCSPGRALVDVNESSDDGGSRSQVRILNCSSAVATPALRLSALRAARAQFAAADSPMAATIGDARTRALAAIDAQIAELERQQR